MQMLKNNCGNSYFLVSLIFFLYFNGYGFLHPLLYLLTFSYTAGNFFSFILMNKTFLFCVGDLQLCCGSCSNKKAPLQYNKGKIERVCVVCYDIIVNKQPASGADFMDKKKGLLQVLSLLHFYSYQICLVVQIIMIFYKTLW